jgi:hypothetical protein
MEQAMNDKAVKWIGWTPWRWAAWGALIATALEDLHLVSIYLALLPRPDPMGLLVAMWITFVGVFAAAGAVLGWGARAYLRRFQSLDEATAMARTQALPLWYAGTVFAIALAQMAFGYFQFLGTKDEFAIWIVAVVVVAATAIAWLVGVVSRRALHRRLSRAAASARDQVGAQTFAAG